MRLVFLYGPPASGKLTVATALCRLTGYKLLHNHLSADLARALFEFMSPAYLNYNGQIRLDALRTAAEAGIAGVVMTFVYDHGADEDFIARLIAQVEDGGGRGDLVKLDCPDAELLQRVAAPERSRFHKLTSAATLAECLTQRRWREPLPHRHSLMLDTQQLTVAESALTIIHQLGLVQTSSQAAE